VLISGMVFSLDSVSLNSGSGIFASIFSKVEFLTQISTAKRLLIDTYTTDKGEKVEIII
jgi:hypothetical protein